MRDEGEQTGPEPTDGPETPPGDGAAIAVTERRFRKAMAQLPAGVTIVAADDGDAAHGLTVSSFTSVSLAPPQCLICVQETSPLLPILRRAGAFAVHVLSEPQSELALLFAGRDAAARARALRRQPGAPPRVEGFLLRFEMRLSGDLRAGDHAVLIGDVASIEPGARTAPLDGDAPVDDSEPPSGRPLTWWRSRLGSLGPRSRGARG